MSTAEDPHGPWAPLHLVQRVEKWEDPCPLWDTDGMAYLGRSRHGAGPIIVHKMSPDGRQLLDEGVTVYEGPIAEGTKWLKRNGWYYLIIPEGGVGTGWQTVLRSKNIYGPYERKIVLEQGSTNINGPHQGALVDTPDGKWWFYHFQETPVLGRVIHLQPVRWEDDWPLMGEDYDGNGIGEPVFRHSSPKLAPSASISSPKLGEARRGLNNRRSPSPQTSYVSSDFIDDFNISPSTLLTTPASKLKLAWQWNHNPDDSHWSLSEHPEFLTIHAQPADSLKACRNMLTQKVIGYQSESTTIVEASGDCYAGLFCSGKLFTGIGLSKNGVFIEQNGLRRLIQPGTFPRLYLKITNDCQQNRHQYFYSTDGETYLPACEPFPMRGGYWKGIRVGLFCYGTDGMALFDAFRQSVLK